ncbi:MAG TPA: hypothetical protein VJI69_04720 [Bacteroidia bacterium]|nr:hypothetical protein [Bacteroidia bacterium]
MWQSLMMRRIAIIEEEIATSCENAGLAMTRPIEITLKKLRILFQKIKLFLFIIFLTPFICGAFGILHDQITYTLSEEYYTKFKFIQFGLIEKQGMTMEMNHRLGAVIVGFGATWWVGIPIGLFYAITLMFFKSTKNLYKLYFKTVLLTFAITIVTSFAGYLYWKLILQNEPPNWYLPETVRDRNSFFCVGSIHNFSYLGAEIGLIAGMLYLILLKRKEKNASRSINFRK